jgi:hypothetical protein
MKFVAHDVAKVEPDPTSATLQNVACDDLEVDTRSNSAIAGDVSRNVASCVHNFTPCISLRFNVFPSSTKLTYLT